jgi:hypothetical protein
MQIPMVKVLAGAPAIRHNWYRPLIPGGRCSQGGVKVPTGGKGEVAQARERLLPAPCLGTIFSENRFPLFRIVLLGKRVSRFGAIPKPTVKVRMKENGRAAAFLRGALFRMP